MIYEASKNVTQLHLKLWLFDHVIHYSYFIYWGSMVRKIPLLKFRFIKSCIKWIRWIQPHLHMTYDSRRQLRIMNSRVFSRLPQSGHTLLWISITVLIPRSSSLLIFYCPDAVAHPRHGHTSCLFLIFFTWMTSNMVFR